MIKIYEIIKSFDVVDKQENNDSSEHPGNYNT